MDKILLVEDDQSFGYILSEYLTMHDLMVDWAKSGEIGMDFLQRHTYQLVVLDIMLPGIDGFEVAASIRQRYPSIPFIFLSAMALKVNKLKGYKLGAFDYITKPIDEEILLAKIRALLRRSPAPVAVADSYTIGEYHFNVHLQYLQFGEKRIQLTQRESELLVLFCQHENVLLPRELALKKIWQSTDEFSRKSMDVFVSHLRKHLSKDANIRIKNIHGKGFVFSIKEN